MGIEKDEKLLKTAAALRSRAEKQLKSKKTASDAPQKDAETLRILHELQVHQIELEMQNVELRQARDNMEVELGKYADLYDYAPTGYITLDCPGTVLSANLTAADLLGNDRSRLIGQRFGLYLTDQARLQFADFLRTVFISRIKESCETSLTIDGKTTLFAQIDAVASEDGQTCRVAIIDITKRKQAEEALLVSENIYRAIGESIDYGIWICDPDGRNLYASQSFLDLVGMSQEQCSNFGWGDVLHPDDAEQTIAAWKECVRTENTWDIEHRYRGVDGQWHDILARGLPVRNEQGDIINWSGINLDISQLKQTEKALRQSEERHRVLAETMLQGVVHQDSAGRIISMNPAAERILGKSREEFVGNNSVTVEHDTMRENGEIFPGAEHPTMVALRTGHPVSGVVMGVFNPRMNELRWIDIDAVPVFRPGEDLPSEVYSIFEDITERKQSEIALQESEQRIQQALHISRSFTFDWRPVTDQVIRSSSCAAILKLTDDEAVNDTGDHYFQSIHPDDRSRFGRILGDLTPACDSYTAEYRYMCKDGSVITLEETARAFFDSSGKMLRLVGVATDITSRKAFEQALQRAHDELEQRVRDRTADLESAVEVLQVEIAERIKAEHELERSAHEIEDLYNLAPCGYHSLDKEGMFVRINDTELNWLGYERNEIINRMKVSDLMTPESLAAFADQFPRFMKGSDIGDQRFNFIRKDGSIMPVLLNATPILDDNGDYIMSRSTIYDITELAQAEENIRRLNRLYLTLSETGKAIARFPGRNELFQQICRIAVEQGGFRMVWLSLIDEETEMVLPVASYGYGTDYLENIRISARPDAEGMGPTGKVVRFGGHYICNDFMSDPCTIPWRSEAEQCGFLSSAALAISLNGRVVGAITLYAAEKDYFDTQIVELLQQMQSDISFALDNLERETRRREAESALKAEIIERLEVMKELREKEQMLLQQSRLAAMGEMINNIAHQWRQPLNALGLLIQKLPIYYDSAEFNQEFLEENTVKSMKLIQHMSQTINDFRDFFRSDKEMETFFLDTVVRQAVALIEQNFRDFGIKIELDNEQNLMVKGYPNEFAQALLNILMNAYDALVGNNTADARIILRVFKDGGSSVVTVTDNAGGIPGEVIDRVFDPYFTTKGPDKGTGLGLFMSKTIIEKNIAGRLTVRNTGNGAEFRIEVAYDVK